MEDGGLGARRTSRVSRASLPDELDEDECSLDNWKPSVYWVMLYLTLASVTLALCAAAVYTPFENWSFFESIYFCFVSFATIGFGDYVSTQVRSVQSLQDEGCEVSAQPSKCETSLKCMIQYFIQQNYVHRLGDTR
jgi:hypothetical protein